MVVDDSVVARGLISRWVDATPEMVVVASAATGRAALERLDEAAPDVVLLDLDMPEMDGLSALPLLLGRRPGLSVVIVSTLSQRNADVTLQCLQLGAVDYLPKPSGSREITIATEFRRELVAKLEGLALRHRPPLPGLSPFAGLPSGMGSRSASALRAVLIGASTGGPRAVIEVLRGVRALSAKLPVLVAQHMPAIFTTVFADHVRQATGLAACEAKDGDRVEAGRVLIAPGGFDMGLRAINGRVHVRLEVGRPPARCRPALDVLFADAARHYGPTVAAVVLTGMGQDGTQGARALVAAGATVLVQDEGSSTVWGMPGSIARAGLARAVLPLERLAPTLRAMAAGSAAP